MVKRFYDHSYCQISMLNVVHPFCHRTKIQLYRNIRLHWQPQITIRTRWAPDYQSTQITKVLANNISWNKTFWVQFTTMSQQLPAQWKLDMNVKYQQYFLGLTMLTSDNHVVYWHITKHSLVEVYMFQHFSSIEEIGTVWYSYLDQHAGMQLPSTEELNHRKAAC